MDDGSRLPILISILLLAGAVYFALAETAFSSCSRVRMRAAAERGEPGAKQALYISFFGLSDDQRNDPRYA